MEPVIIFGPTGNVGSIVAQTASELGAKVILAMRDTKKAIPGIPESADGKFERVAADLTDPASCAEAVRSTGARRAYIYLAHGSTDGMKSVLEQIKAAGITFVVFLSSFTVPTDKPLDSVDPSDLIAWWHAQVELNLDSVFGERYVAIRPGAFATNLLRWKDQIDAGEVKLYAWDFPHDLVTAKDMGQISAHVLVNGAKNGQRKVYVYGPQKISLSEAIAELGRTIGKNLKMTRVDAKEELDMYISGGMPRPMAEYMIEAYGRPAGSIPWPHYEEGVNNVKLYLGRPATPFSEWIMEHWEFRPRW